MSAKNVLQEYFQKHHLVLPEYNTYRIDGDCDHQPGWISRITLADGDNFVSQPRPSKKSAELEVAKLAYESVSHRVKLTPKEEIDLGNLKIAIMIDAENKPLALDEIVGRIELKNINIFAVYSSGHPVGKKFQGDNIHVKIQEIPSTRVDGADVGLIMMTGMMLQAESFDSYIIISNDHFADVLSELISKFHIMFPGINKKYGAMVCRNIDDIISALQNIKSMV